MGRSPAPVRFGPFEVEGRIGVGGMGEVFRARLVDADRLVALKLILPEHANDPRFRKMFTAEAQVGALLHHRNIVELVDFGAIDGVLYLALEHVDGLPLSRLTGGVPWPEELAVFVALELLDALAYAHGRNDKDGRPLHLVHRDVSTDNVLASVDGEVKLTDFGVAKVAGTTRTSTHELKGKLGYMAPEQLERDAPVDGRADLFAVGVVLHRLLYQRGPFTDVTDWLRDGARLTVGGPLGDVLKRALAPRVEDRFASARELAAALRAALAPPSDARQQLAARVRARGRVEAPLGSLDQLILAELGDGNRAGAVKTATRQVPIPPSARHSIEFGDTFVQGAPQDGSEPPSTPTLARTGPARSSTPRPARARLALLGATALLAASVAITIVALRARRPLPLDPPTPSPPLAVAPARVDRAPTGPVRIEPVTVAPEESEPPVAAARGGRRSAAAAPGFLTLDTEPWASVYLGGRRLGTTPFARVPLPSGNHTLELDVRGTGRRRKVKVHIPPGGEARLAIRLP